MQKSMFLCQLNRSCCGLKGWSGAALLCLLILSLPACDNGQRDLTQNNGSGTRLGDGPAVSMLRIMVLDDPELAKALQRWQYEWKTLSGGTYTVTSVQGALPENWQHGQDVVIYPSLLLGELAEKKAIIPIRTRLLEQENYIFDDIFPLLREQVACWDKEPYALTLGTPVFTLAYRADILESQSKAVPKTWEEYEELVEYFSRRENWGTARPAEDAEWQPAVEPLAEGWASHLFLTRAASYARHRNQISTLFDRTSMQPLINTPPYERALRELVTVAGPLSVKSDPPAALMALQSGQCVFALTWPYPAGVELEIAPPDEVSSDRQRIAFTELPGVYETYSYTSRDWDESIGAYETRATYLGVPGRLGSVSHRTLNAASAMRFLAWLTRAHASEQISAASPATTLFRRSQVAAPQAWISDKFDHRAARDFTRCVDMALSRESFLLGPRLPGANEYLAALNAAVKSALSEETTPQQALDEATARWREITEARGVAQQYEAYLHSIGQKFESRTEAK